MKVCPNCNNSVEDSAQFCATCGARFAVDYTQQPQQPVYQQPQQFNQPDYTQQQFNQPNYAQQPQQPVYQQPQFNQPNYAQPTYQPPQPKKSKTGLIIGIVAGAVALIAVIAIIIGVSASKDDNTPSHITDFDPSFNQDITSNDADTNYTDNNTPSYSYDYDPSFNEDFTSNDTDTNDIPAPATYTKGAITEGWYVNNWANLRFDTTGWTEGDASEYASYEGDDKTQCGLALNKDDNTKQLDICFEKLPAGAEDYSEDSYISILENGLSQQYSLAGYSVSIEKGYTTTIAGQNFKTLKISFNDLPMVQSLHVLNKDGYMIYVGVIAPDAFEVSAIVNNIRTVE